jgi:hypothetical protein
LRPALVFFSRQGFEDAGTHFKLNGKSSRTEPSIFSIYPIKKFEGEKMIKKLGVKIVILSVVFLLSGIDVMAQTRIRFRRGASSATVSGTLAPGATRGFVLGARRGQILTATLSSGNNQVDFTQGNLHDTQYSMQVQRNGDVYISIDNHGRRATRYTLTVSIQ